MHKEDNKEFILVHLCTKPRKGVIAKILKDKKEYSKSTFELAVATAFNKATGLNLDKNTIMTKYYVNSYTNIEYYDDGKSFNLQNNQTEFSLYHKTSDYIFTEISLLKTDIDNNGHNRIVSIDFETASGKRASVCSIGYVVEDDGEIIKEDEILVNPKAEFSKIAMRIHNISPEDVKHCPTWDKAWPLVEKYITPTTLVIGHNLRSIELSCIRQECERYNMDIPDFAKLHSKHVYDTLKLSKELLPNLESYKLNDLAEMYNIDLNHHNALSDARACLELFNKLQEHIDFDVLNEKLNDDKPKSKRSPKSHRDYSKILTPNTDDFDTNHICFNKKFIFTGTFTNISRKDANQSVLDLGGKLGNGITKDTDYLVLGNSDYNNLSTGKMSTKTKKASEYNDKGANIEIISEDDFLSMIN